ncbi:MAG TPA: Na+/H+ antiporter subunit G [Candidatus Accumulibacter phosphatis]|nr:MAG: Multiple resistance and pH homeostasis protein G [Candidatus Accumulibacter sp. SK-11]HAY29654.1 Na+/H+ antiporter subunit G [Accumulibacter sp.]HRL75437.1 Na+/H+ antiporter subunit G [Candidatus Accumulibacter phosphatis]HCV12567.1 Na+/H+ antiporter subunit G [Accumulibacter sp.]HRQ93995.1 Na+/H+ antiporter subunit G [Candidatus Accumulibacter phosphatis]
MSPLRETLIAALIVLGALFVLLGSIGLARLPDFLTRLHGPTKATTVGVGAILLASAIFFSGSESSAISLHELAILLFLFITAPVTAHLLAKAALHRQLPGTDVADAETPANDKREAPD